LSDEVLGAGRIEEQDACADVLERPALDYSRMLLAAVPTLVTH
jgi:ABC-type glutathione transport system ATPase component